jgi:hypothetical protein
LRVIQTLLVEDKHRSKKAYLSIKEIADKIKLSQEQVQQGVDYILNETGDDILFVIGKGEKQKFGIDFDFNEEKLKEILKNNEKLLNSYKENIHQLKTAIPKKPYKKRKPQ